jgi:hypothetical protein
LLEILIDANSQEYQLAEVEGDALFFFKESELPSYEQLLAKVEKMFTAFYSHLELLKENRICPCTACASAPNLNLKIIAHSAELQFITVQDRRKPFGTHVIEAHRLMKNSIEHDNYVLLSKSLADDILLPEDSVSGPYDFKKGKDKYDENEIDYLFSIIHQKELELNPVKKIKKIEFDDPPGLMLEEKFPASAAKLLEYITNYRYREHWIQGVEDFKYIENEVTKIGTEHLCIVNGKDINFTAVTKDVEPEQFVYGELTTDSPIVDEIYQFFIIDPISDNSSLLHIEIYWTAKSLIRKFLISAFAKKLIYKNTNRALENLLHFVKSRE